MAPGSRRSHHAVRHEEGDRGHLGRPADALGRLTLLLFIVWHLLNFTIGKVNVAGGPTNDLYDLLVDSFAIWWLTLIYLVAMAMLGAHLHHGIWSAAQTLGWTSHARSRWIARSSRSPPRHHHLGFSLVPVFVLAGVIDK